ncbi:MAG TPA: hypothetical protein VJU61_08255 [Polyangiaceae bacterium]|nr:hypothetical protein [Polyangiaceae bacterium]
MERTKGLRFEWRGTAIPEELRTLAEAQAQSLADCGRMRALTIEHRPRGERSEYRVCCRCAERGRCILAGRLGLALAIEAFRAAQHSRCRS